MEDYILHFKPLEGRFYWIKFNGNWYPAIYILDTWYCAGPYYEGISILEGISMLQVEDLIPLPIKEPYTT